MVRIKQCTFLHHCIGDMVWELGELQKQQKEAVLKWKLTTLTNNGHILVTEE